MMRATDILPLVEDVAGGCIFLPFFLSLMGDPILLAPRPWRPSRATSSTRRRR